MDKISLKKVEFYITNVCNLTCDYCNRFNNLNFKGWQDWQDYSEIYRQWADLLDIQQIVVMGGEPLLNPSIVSWAEGLTDIFHQPVQILSNGTRINHVRGLYDLLTRKPVWIGITLHNVDEIHSIVSAVEEFLQVPVIKTVGRDKKTKFNADIQLQDANGITIPFNLSDDFLQNALLPHASGGWTLHDSDPVKSHEICGFAQAKCYHFIRGRLYKCGPVGILPDLDQQINLRISDQDRELLHSYQPLSLENCVPQRIFPASRRAHPAVPILPQLWWRRQDPGHQEKHSKSIADMSTPLPG